MESHALKKYHQEIEPRADGTRRFEFRCYGCFSLLGVYAIQDDPWFFEIKCTDSTCKALRSHGNVVPMRLYEFRCQGRDDKRSEKFGKDITCNKLLGRVLPGTDFERKCPRCGALANAKDRQPNDETGRLE